MKPCDVLQRYLAEHPRARRVFCRSDDGGWGNAALERLAELHAAHGMPLDVAVIPDAMDAANSAFLDTLLTRHGEVVRLHQHGYRHVNHQAQGRKCEFGDRRGYAQQLDDIATGQSLLDARFGPRVAPVFTPPWNRCTGDTVRVLESLGIEVLSRNVGAAPLPATDIATIDIAIDWQKHTHGEALSGDAFSAYLGEAVIAADADSDARGSEVATVGFMLHHAVMSEQDFADWDRCLTLLDRHTSIQRVDMATEHCLRGAVVTG